jgi:hypothetical protein
VQQFRSGDELLSGVREHPAYDRTLKWLMSDDNSNIVKTIFDAVIFLAYTNLENKSREWCESKCGQIDAMTEQLKRLPSESCNFQQLMVDVPVMLCFGRKPDLESVTGIRDDLESVIDEIMNSQESGRSGDEGNTSPDAMNNIIEGLNALKVQIDKIRKNTDIQDCHCNSVVKAKLKQECFNMELL